MRDGVQSCIAKLITCGIFCFRDAVGCNKNFLSGLQVAMSGDINYAAQKAHNKISFFEMADWSAADDKRPKVSAIQMFDAAIGKEFQQNHGRVFSDIASAEELINDGSNLRQTASSEELGV